MSEQPRELFSEEPERAVLSLYLNFPELFDTTRNLNPSNFSSAPNKIIFGAMQELREQSLVPDVTLLVETLRANGRLEDVGSEEYVNFLKNQTYNKENFKSFEELVLNSSRSRSLLSLAQTIPAMIRQGGDILSVIVYIRDTLSSLLSNAGGDLTLLIKELLGGQWSKIQERVANKGVQGISTGFRGVDLFTNGGEPGDFFVIAGRPSQGKTAWMLNSALNTEVPSLIFSLEMGSEPLIDRMLAIVTQTNLAKLRQGDLTQERLDSLAKGVELLNNKEIYIDVNFASDFTYISNTIRRYVRMYGVKAVYIDYVQLLAERSMDSTNELGRISRGLKLLANELGIVVYLFSQLNRLVETRDNKRPILSDLRASGNLEEDPDVVIFLYRDEYYNPATNVPGVMEQIIRKNRNGGVGTVETKFIKETVTILSGVMHDNRRTAEEKTEG